jgi:hypothetical protein
VQSRRDNCQRRLAACCLGLLGVLLPGWLFGAQANEPNFFDPDGYYLPASDSTMSGYRIEWLELTTLEYYYNGALHYDKPRPLPSAARLALARMADGMKSIHRCPAPSVSRDALAIRCPATPIGAVAIRGAFLDKRGQFWNRGDIPVEKPVVMVATVTAGRGDKAQLFSVCPSFIRRVTDFGEQET